MDEQEGGGTRQQERHLKLVAKREPVLLHVVLPPEDLQLAGTRRKPLDESIDFVRLVASVANLQAQKNRIRSRWYCRSEQKNVLHATCRRPIASMSHVTPFW